MRRVQVGDVLALAGAIAGQAKPFALALRLCAEAHAAHSYMKRHHRLHPRWGNGSLMSRAYADGAVMLSDWSDQGLAALGLASAALATWRAERLDCRSSALYDRMDFLFAETTHGRNPAETHHHRSGLGTRLCRGA